MWDFNQPYFEGKMIPAAQAWRRFDEWMSAGKQIGVWFVAKSGTLRTSGFVEGAESGRVNLRGQSAAAGFNLRDARFTYGPFQIFPNWPSGPMVEVMAVQAFLPNGDWLVMAEGLKPDNLAPLALPA